MDSWVKKPYFSGHTSGRILGLANNALIIIFLEMIGADNASSIRPIKFKK